MTSRAKQAPVRPYSELPPPREQEVGKVASSALKRLVALEATDGLGRNVTSHLAGEA